MTQEQEIRAWALAIALLTEKPAGIEALKDDALSMSLEFLTLVKAIERYITFPPKGDQILHG